MVAVILAIDNEDYDKLATYAAGFEATMSPSWVHNLDSAALHGRR